MEIKMETSKNAPIFFAVLGWQMLTSRDVLHPSKLLLRSVLTQSVAFMKDVPPNAVW